MHPLVYMGATEWYPREARTVPKMGSRHMETYLADFKQTFLVNKLSERRNTADKMSRAHNRA